MSQHTLNNVEPLRPAPRPCQVITLRPLTGNAALLAQRRAARRRNLRRLGLETGGRAA